MAICHVAPDIQTCYTLQKYVTLYYKTLHLWVGSALCGQGGVCVLCTVNCPGYCVSGDYLATTSIFVTAMDIKF